MKPVYLEFSGINSFSEPAKIDFTKLLTGGLFGIFGDTGSGKSTILDCIHFALYGEIERASGTDSINYRCDKAYVIYDFEILHDGARHTYRIQRERRRKNNSTKAFLYEYDGNGKLQALAEGMRDVNKVAIEIVGLGFDDFKKCIALPQGEFAGLVKAQNAERLKLVSRLFDLEKYGEKLSAKVNERWKQIDGDIRILEMRMKENDGGREEIIAAEREKLAETQKELDGVKRQTEEAEERYSQLHRLFLEKVEYDRLEKEAEAAERKLSQYEERRRRLEKYPLASRIVETATELATEIKKKSQAAADAELESVRSQAAAKDAEILRNRLAESGIAAEIEKKQTDLGTALACRGDKEACHSDKAALDKCIAEYKKIKDKIPCEPFDELLTKKRAERDALGADVSFVDFLKSRFGKVLTAELRDEVRADLCRLGEKYPQTEEDIARLIKKYAAAPAGSENSLDIAEANREFKNLANKRESLRTEIENIEKRKSAYEENEKEKTRLIEDGKHYRERYDASLAKIEKVKDLGSPDQIEKEIETLKASKERAEKEILDKERQVSAHDAEAKKHKALCEEHAQKAETRKSKLDSLMKESGFADESEAKTLATEIADHEKEKADCDEFFGRYALCKSKLAEKAGKFDGYTSEALVEAKEKKESFSARKEELIREETRLDGAIRRLVELKEKYEEAEKQYRQKTGEKELWEKLRDLTSRNKFMEFIASEYLQEICVSASKTLLSLTGGRYFLRYDGDFQAGDNFNGGTLRGVKTLSGGETFLVSLSLALALSGAICAKSLRPIEFFFLDEGFGTLDEKLVDVVMDVLEKLRSRSFSVGVISHVEELKRRIENKVLVTGATDARGSSLRVEAF